MKKFRLMILILMLVGGISMFNPPVSADECSDEEGPCTGYDRPNGCKCCSENHCHSNYCDKTNHCADLNGGG